MRKQIVLLAKKMTACGLAAAMLFGVGPFDKVTTSKRHHQSERRYRDEPHQRQ